MANMEIVNRNSVKPFITKDTAEIREIIAPSNTSVKRQSIAEATVAPGKSTEAHYHIKVEETYYIIQGKGKMVIDTKVCDVAAGDGIVILPGETHYIVNAGNNHLIFLCFCTPAYTHEDTILVK
jgi:mannose-6-phosphate isomerase-like protein (cupin superfamily)